MHGVAGAIGGHVAENLVADERQIADQIQNFVPDKLIRETQRRIYQTVAGQHQRVLRRRPANQPLLAHGFGLMQKSKGPCRSNVGDVVPVGQGLSESLASNQRMWKIDGVGNRIAVRRKNTDELIAFTKFQGLKNPDVSSRAALLTDPGAADQVHEWPRASVENGQLQVVQLDVRVVDSHPYERREQVFGSGNQDALL